MIERTVGTTVVKAVMGDLTRLPVDVVVNAANSRLIHGGGVAGAIVRAGGPSIQVESDRIVQRAGAVATGSAVATGAGTLPATWVVHAVGPVYRGMPDDARLLRSAVVAALDRAYLLGARSVAMPAISAGVYGYPRGEATAVIAAAVVSWVEEHPGDLDEVLLVGFDDAAAADFAAALEP